MMEKQNVKKIGIVASKIALTVVALVFAAGLAGKFSKVIVGLNYGSMSMASVLIISMIIPIWYGAPIRWRIAAPAAAIAAGLGTWLISLFVGSSDIASTSQMIGIIRAGSIIVSLVVCVSILRVGRLREGRSQGRRLQSL